MLFLDGNKNTTNCNVWPLFVYFPLEQCLIAGVLSQGSRCTEVFRKCALALK